MKSINLRRALLLGTAACALNTAAAFAQVVTDGSGNVTISGATTGVALGPVTGTLSNTGAITSTTYGVDVAGSVGGDVIYGATITAPMAGIYVQGNVGGSVSIGSGETINNTTGGYGVAVGQAGPGGTGVYVAGTVGGNIVNAGSIMSTNATGLHIAASMAGTVSNSGLISGTHGIGAQGSVGALSNTGTVTASVGQAIYILGGVTGSVINSGQILGGANAAPLYIGGAVGGLVSNTGTISGHSAGVWVTGSIGGDLLNSGSIASAVAQGILVDGDVGGGVSNTGVITAGGPYGIEIDGGVTGDVTYGGHITATDAGIYVGRDVGGTISIASGATIAPASGGHGILVSDNNGDAATNGVGVFVAGTADAIDNAGTITATNTVAVFVDGDLHGALTNSGQISGARGIFVNGSVGAFSNIGTITASVGSAVFIGTGVAGNFSNTGMITSGPTSGAVYIAGNVGGNLSNTGTITAVASQGIFVQGGVGGTVSNTNVITANSGNAIEVDGAVGGDLTNSGTLTAGAIGAYVGGSVVGDVINTGTLSGGRFGIYVDGAVGGDVVEGGVSNGGGIGIYAGAVTGDVSVTSAMTTTNGYGVEVGGGSISASPGDTGIYIAGAVGGTLVNSGTITSDTGHAAVKVAAGKLDLTNTGTITGGAGVALDYSAATAPSTLTQTSGLIAGSIVSNAAVADVIDYNGGSIAGAISGAMDTVNIGGAVSSGGSMSVGAINVLNTGVFTLGHDVTVTGGFTNAGTLAVFTTRTITGDFTQSAGGVLAIGVNGPTAGKLAVTHNATLTAASTINVVELASTPITSSTSYTIVSAGNIGSYGGVVIGTNPFLGLTATKSVVGNDLILTLAPTSGDGAGTGTGTGTGAGSGTGAGGDGGGATTPVVTGPTSNAASVGAALTTLFRTYGPNSVNGPPVLALINAYFGNTASTLTQAQKTALVVGELSPSTHLLDAQAMEQFSFAAADAVTTHNLNARTADNCVNTCVNAGAGSQNSTVWGQIMGFTSRRASETDTAGNTVSDGGVAFGADTLVTSRLRLGASIAYAHANARGLGTDSGNSTSIDAYQLTAYGSYNAGPWYVNGQLGADLAKYGQNRNLVFLPTAAKASYNGDGLVAHIDGGRDFQVGRTTLTPVAGLSYSNQHINSFTETGTGESFDAANVSAVQTDIGAKAAWTFTHGANHFTPTVKLAWLHDWIGSPLETTSAIGGVTFQTLSRRPASDGVGIGLALAVYNRGDWQLSAQYDGSLYSNYTSNAAMLNLRVNF